MGLSIQRLVIQASTALGTYGAELKFNSGLCVISSVNTTGKSTCLQAIVYALGLERMLSPKRAIPLPYALQTRLIDDRVEREIDVLESWVIVEVSNDRGDILTVRRSIKGEQDHRLISTWDGPALSDPGRGGHQRDYYVLDPGAATRDIGFHRRLAQFIGWNLPTVAKYDGSETPLYVETIFPLIFVEQKSGWGALPGSFPTYMGIREIGKRAVEFLLGFESHEVELRRQRVQRELQAVRETWAELCSLADRIVSGLNGRVEGLPLVPQTYWPLSPAITVLIPENGAWKSLNQERSEINTKVASLLKLEIPTAGAASAEAVAELNNSLRVLEELTLNQANLLRELSIERSQQVATERRINALREDLRKHQDIKKLVDLGSDVAGEIASTHCPTCHQFVDEAFLPVAEANRVLTIDENISYLREQLGIVTDAEASSSLGVMRVERMLLAVNSEISQLRARIRALKQSVIQATSAPSIAAIQERVLLEERLRQIERVEGELSDLWDLFASLAIRYSAAKKEEKSLPRGTVTPRDSAKLQLLEQLVTRQLVDYGFRTFSPNELSIALDSYRPVREGFDIGFELSASDAIRLKWAYQVGLLELAREFHDTNHPGILILDEPGQQEVEKPSLRGLIQRTAQSRYANQQVIIATSEEITGLRTLMRGSGAQLIELDGYLLQRES